MADFLSDEEMAAFEDTSSSGGDFQDQTSWFDNFQRGLPIATEAMRSGLARMPSATARGAAGLAQAAGELLPDWLGAERMRDRALGTRMAADAWDQNVRSQTAPDALSAADKVAGIAGIFPQILAAPVALPMMATMAGGNTYADARDQGRTVNQSLLAGGVDAGATAATMAIPLGVLNSAYGPIAKMLGAGSSMAMLTPPMLAQEAIRQRLVTKQPIDSASFLDRMNPFSDAGQNEYGGNFATGAILSALPHIRPSEPAPIETRPVEPQSERNWVPEPVAEAKQAEPAPVNHLLPSGVTPNPKAVQMEMDNLQRFDAAKGAMKDRADKAREVVAERFDPIKQVEDPTSQAVLQQGDSPAEPKVYKRDSFVVRPDLMQFRQNTDATTGVKAGNEIDGKSWDPIAGGVLTLWEPTPETAKKLGIPEGKLVVVNGHHRVAYADKVGNKEFAGFTLKESDGISLEEARIRGAELNIVDNKGDFRDKLVFFKGLSDTYGKEVAQQRARDLGIKDRIAPRVAFEGSDYLLESARNGKITEQHAGTIVTYAKGSEKAQAAGVEAAKENPDISARELAAKTSAVAAEDLFVSGQQPELFASDTPELKAYLRQRRADYIQEQLTAADETVKHLSRVASDYEGAKRQLKDPGEISDIMDRYHQAKATQDEWHNWTDFRDIRDSIQAQEMQWRQEYAQNPKLGKSEPQQELFAGPTVPAPPPIAAPETTTSPDFIPLQAEKSEGLKTIVTFENGHVVALDGYHKKSAIIPSAKTSFGRYSALKRHGKIASVRTALVVKKAPPRTGEEGVLKFGEVTGELYDRLKAPFENLGVANRNEVQKLPEGERFVGGRMDVQLMPRAMVSAFRKAFTYPRTLAQKFPEFEPIYRIGQDRLKLEAQEAYKINEILQPYWALNKAERAPLDDFMAKDREAAAKQIKAGKPPPPLTPQDLASKGFNEAQIGAYKSVREAMNHALDRLQFVFEHKGRSIKDPKLKQEYLDDVQKFITVMRRQRFVPFSRYGGGFEVASTYSNGDTAYREFFDTRAEAIKAKRRLEAESGNLVVAKERATMDREAWDDLPFAMLGVSKAKFDAGKWTKQAETGEPMLSFTKHLIKASLVPGYEKNLSRSIADYSLGLSRYVAREFYAPELRDSLNKIDPEKTPELKVRAKRYVEDLDKSAPWVSRLMNVSNFMNLAGAPVSAAVNATQTMTTTYPQLLRHVNPVDAAGILGSSFVDASNYIFRKGKGVPPDLAAGLKMALEQGNLESQALNELRRVREGTQLSGAFGKTNEALLTPFTAIEKLNRVVAFSSGFKVATKQGITGVERVRFAEDFVDSTQFVTNRGNLPEVARNPVGRLMLQYKTSYLGNYLRFLRNNLNKEGAATFSTSLGVAYLIGGHAAVPFMKEFVNIAQNFGFDVFGEVRKLFSKNVSDMLISGVTPKITGVDLSGSTGIELLPEFDMSKTSALTRAVGGPTIDYAVTRPMKAWEILKGAPTWDSQQAVMAAEQILPRFLRNPVMAARTAMTGKLTDSQGNQLLPNPDIPGDKPPSTYEIAMMAIGANPQRKATATREKRRIMQLQSRSENAGKYLKERFANAVQNKDPEQIRAVLRDIQEALQGASKPSERFDMRPQDLKRRIDPSPYKNIPKKLLPEAAQIIKQERGLQ